MLLIYALKQKDFFKKSLKQKSQQNLLGFLLINSQQLTSIHIILQNMSGGLFFYGL